MKWRKKNMARESAVVGPYRLSTRASANGLKSLKMRALRRECHNNTGDLLGNGNKFNTLFLLVVSNQTAPILDHDAITIARHPRGTRGTWSCASTTHRHTKSGKSGSTAVCAAPRPPQSRSCKSRSWRAAARQRTRTRTRGVCLRSILFPA